MAKLKPKDPLAKVRKDPSNVKSFELNPADARNNGFDVQPLTSFPEEVLACKNLERLEIFRGIDGPRVTIPEGIGRLTALRTLSLGGLSIKALPEGIGRLRKLRSLSLDYNEQLTALPDAIGQLTALENLGLSYTALKALPKSIGKLKKLKTLTLHEVVEIPKELFELTSLVDLDLGAAEELPPGLGRLSSLRSLTIHSRALAKAGAEIAKLSKLESLFIRGGDATPPAAIFAIPTLVTLRVRGVGLTSLPPLDKLKKLERLDLGDNELTALAAAVAVLPRLTELDFSGNPLPVAEKRAVAAMMKLSPKERAAKVPATTPDRAPERAPRAVTPAPKKAAEQRVEVDDNNGPKRIGDVVGQNASLAILIAEGQVASKYKGTSSDDWERATRAVEKANAAAFTIGKGTALVLSLEVGQGKASVWMLEDGTLALVEAVFEEDEKSLDDDDRGLFQEFVGGPRAKGAKPAGKLQIKAEQDWAIVLVPTTDDCSDVAKLLKTTSLGRPRACGSEKSGLLIDVWSRKWTLFVEPPLKAAWGSGRRALLVPD